MVCMYKLIERSHRESLKKIYREIFGVSAVFVVSLLVGVYISLIYPNEIQGFFQDLFESIEPYAEMGDITFFLLILLNNTVKTFVFMLTGLISLGTLPILFVSINGMIIGLLYELVASTAGTAVFFFATLPHGIFEIPALVISSALGLYLGMQALKSRKENISIRREIRSALSLYFHLVLPILFIAAFIEVFVSPYIVGILL